MADYKYQAKEGLNKLVRGSVAAESEDQAIMKILAMGLTPVDVRAFEEKQKLYKKREVFSWDLFSKRVSRHQILLFTRQLSDLLEAGVPLLQALLSIRSQKNKGKFSKIIDAIILAIEDGGLFSSALSAHPFVFSSIYINMVKSGETSGTLNVVIQRLADFMEKDLETRRKVQTSLIYPALIFVVGWATIFILLTWVIPSITVIFEDLSESLPLSTMILMAISNFFARTWMLLGAGLIGCGIFLWRFISTENGRVAFDQFKLRLPIFGSFIKEALLGRFARTLGSLLENGVPISSALESCVLVLDNVVMQREVKLLAQEVVGGTRLSQAIENKSLFLETAQKMIAVGEETGNMHQSLFKLALYYERQSNAFIKRLLSLIEPVMILVLGSIVAFVVMAMLLPMFQMNLIIN